MIYKNNNNKIIINSKAQRKAILSVKFIEMFLELL
jgi:hypothetical protein